MNPHKIFISPVTRLSGLLSLELTIDKNQIIEGNVSSTMFRGYESIMKNRHVTDAVYLTQRICGICSTVHGATASYLLDELYDHDIEENAQYLRNIILGADFLQNHIRHFYFFGLPDFVIMPDQSPFLKQNCADCRLATDDNQRLAGHYIKAVEASQKCHQLLAIFGGKAPHQHSFLHGGVAVDPTVDKITHALALIHDIHEFVQSYMITDTELISYCYSDYFHIGETSESFLSFGLFRFGLKNEELLWKCGVLEDDHLTVPRLDLIQEDITRAWYEPEIVQENVEISPAPYKPKAYTWTKSVLYQGKHYEGGPLARMRMNGYYHGGTSTMDRIVARSLETLLIAELVTKWLHKLKPGKAPIKQKNDLAVNKAIAATDAMRGPLLHSASLAGEAIEKYNIITPTGWNFSPKDCLGNRGPAETALVGTKIPSPELTYVIPGRIIRSFDPCISCATHFIDLQTNSIFETIY